ncbi:hypothetical protein CXP39_01465 [Mesoplasma syrphidae]|uniref:Uncharacterized protein n=1 Tax=Mesoplasma syrphidae TaxID=225999 RepID=A0A2K9BJL4_9MOLU|nr:hypothetical protein [Mesoplasma syrphidae]AUF83466.1 hypothetical protein CXP39_01465 [Mesoplasma syrphidae]
MKNRAQVFCLLWIAVIPLGVVLLDLFLSIVEQNNDSVSNNFDISLINQVIYLSVWNAIISSIWGICNLIKISKPQAYQFLGSRETFTLITTLNIFVFLVYATNFIVAPDTIPGFKSWYQILKSVLEHFVTPPLVVLLYFMTVEKRYSSRQYAKRGGWNAMIIPGAYIVFIMIRAAFLYSFSEDPFTPFPYAIADPWKVPLWLSAGAILGALFANYGIATFLNCMSNRIHYYRYLKPCQKVKSKKAL